MPNILDDGFLDQATVASAAARVPGNSDFALQAACSNAITSAAIGGAFSCTVNVASYTATLITLMIQRLVNMGFTATLSGSTLTVTWP